jgi:elongation factor Ts
MAEFTAKDVQALRKLTGAGMMDCKRALTETDGDPVAAAQWLREKGLAKSADRAGRENTEGAVAVSEIDGAAAIVELKCETDFAAKSDQFTSLVQEIAALVAANGEDAAATKQHAIEDLNVVLKENIALGQVVRVQAEAGHVIDTYVHRRDGRGVNGVIVELDGGTPELAHDIAVHVAFARPPYLRREDVPEADVAAERETLTKISQAEGKPEAALDKIVTGRLNGWYKERVLLEQGFVKDEKRTIADLLGGAQVSRVAQVVIGG